MEGLRLGIQKDGLQPALISHMEESILWSKNYSLTCSYKLLFCESTQLPLCWLGRSPAYVILAWQSDPEKEPAASRCQPEQWASLTSGGRPQHRDIGQGNTRATDPAALAQSTGLQKDFHVRILVNFSFV